jgi:hypothetical protein
MVYHPYQEHTALHHLEALLVTACIMFSMIALFYWAVKQSKLNNPNNDEQIKK